MKHQQNPPKNKNEYNSVFFTHSLSFIISSGYIHYAYNSVVYDEMQHFMVKFFNWTKDEELFFNSWISAIFVLGASIGALLSLPFVARTSRTRFSFILDSIIIVGALLTLIAEPYVIMTGRFIIGLGTGANTVVVLIYLKEISTIDTRGIILSYTGILYNIGNAISYLFDLGLPIPDSNGDYDITSQWWRFQFGFPIMFTLIRMSLINLVFDFQTPKYLWISNTLKGKYMASLAMEKTVRKDLIPKYMKEIEDELHECKNCKQINFKELFSHSYRRATILMILLIFFQQYSGINVVFVFLAQIIQGKEKKVDVQLARGLSVLIPLFSLLFSIILSSFIDTKGRRKLLTYWSFLFFLSILGLGIVIYFDRFYERIIFIGIISACYTLSLGNVVYAYIPEILPEIGISLAWVLHFGFQFTVLISFQYITDGTSESGVFFLYSGITFIGSIFIYLFVPETMKKSFHQIYDSFHGRIILPGKIINDNLEITNYESSSQFGI